MSKSFDDILNKGKQAANVVDPKDEWKTHITNIMFELHILNEMYKDLKSHNLAVEQQKCGNCQKATFILSVRDWDDRGKALKFHKGNWKAIDADNYLCDQCKS